MKDFFELVLLYGFIILLVGGFMFGMIKFLDHEEKESIKSCKENVAQIGNYEATHKGGYCFFVRDGKLEEAK